MKINPSPLLMTFITAALMIGDVDVCLAEQSPSAVDHTSSVDPALIKFSDRYKETTTVEKLQYIIDNNTGGLARFVAKEILGRWSHDEINRTGSIGFWWHFRHDMGEPYNTVVYLHAHCNPLSQPNGPWPIGVELSARAAHQSTAYDDFIKAGFLNTQYDDRESGDKALDFVDRKLIDR